ncbi:MAG: hypothetical protein KKD90_03115 [Candidatus Omnitrophica bacterium]|nr:hypothetical protein [Candidatus Omnitrophota bacterium]MBU4149268.1 hypothetical protein [Candidatus Omnitrophota bacterium]
MNGVIRANSLESTPSIKKEMERRIFLSKNKIVSRINKADIGSALPDIYVTASVCTGWTAKKRAVKIDNQYHG